MKNKATVIGTRTHTTRSVRYRDFAVFFILAVSVWMTQDFLAPVLVGFVFATVLFPIYERFFPETMSAFWRSLVITLAFAIVFLLPIALLIFTGAHAALDVVSGVQDLHSKSGGSVNKTIETWIASSPLKGFAKWVPLQNPNVQDLLGRFAMAGGEGLAGVFRAILESIPKALFAIFVILFTTHYGLLDGPQFLRFLRKKSPFVPENTKLLIRRARNACHSSIVASAMTGLIQSAILVVGALLTSLSYVALIGLAAFLSSFLPMVGTAPLTLAVSGYLLARGDGGYALLFLVIGILTGVSDNFIRPYFLKGKTKIHPLAGLIFTFGAIDVIGFPGLFLGPVLAGLLFALGDMYPTRVVPDRDEAIKIKPKLRAEP